MRLFPIFFLLSIPALLPAAPSFVPEDAAEKACVELHLVLGFNAENAQSRCGWKERREILRAKSFAQCRAELAAVTADATVPLICFNAAVASAVAEHPARAACIAATSRNLNAGFWFQEDFVLAAKYQRPVRPAKVPRPKAGAKKIPDQPEPTFFQERLLAACAKEPPVQADVGARVLGQLHIHTLAPQRGGEGAIGGFSDLLVDAPGSLMAVSDDLQRPSFGYFDWSWSADGRAVMLGYRTNRALLSDRIVPGKEPQIDLEAMDVLPNGDLVLATEIGARLKDTELAYENSFLLRVGPDGAWKEGVPLRKEFIPYFEKRPVKCTREHRKEKRPCEAYFQVNGFAHNKGIEALALNGRKTHLVYVTEQPVPDHAAPAPKEPPTEGTAYLTAQALGDPQELTTYPYPLSLEDENGVVALRYYRDRTYLALERAYDPKAGEARALLFRIDLPTSAGQPVRKTLLLDLASLRPSFTPGFESVDNFEGLAIGPATAQGTVLFFVSDNNFSVSQRTMLLAVELSKELLP